MWLLCNHVLHTWLQHASAVIKGLKQAMRRWYVTNCQMLCVQIIPQRPKLVWTIPKAIGNTILLFTSVRSDFLVFLLQIALWHCHDLAGSMYIWMTKLNHQNRQQGNLILLFYCSLEGCNQTASVHSESLLWTSIQIRNIVVCFRFVTQKGSKWRHAMTILWKRSAMAASMFL